MSYLLGSKYDKYGQKTAKSGTDEKQESGKEDPQTDSEKHRNNKSVRSTKQKEQIKLTKLLSELYNFGDKEEPPYSRFDTAREGTIEEGPNDPNIFKAIFMAGGPGSGKSFVAEKLALAAKGLKTVNSDDALEYFMKKADLSLSMPPEEQPYRDVVRRQAKSVTKTKRKHYVDGRLGLVIDGTAKDSSAIYKLKGELESLGYQTMMLFVDTNLETALKRNKERPRQVPEDVLKASHAETQKAKDLLKRMFGKDFVEARNDESLDVRALDRQIRGFLSRPNTKTAEDWIKNQKS